MPASNPLRPAYVQRDLSHLPTSSSPLELFQDHDSIPSLDSGSKHSAISTTIPSQPPPLIGERCGPSQSPHSFQAQRQPLLPFRWGTGSSWRKTEGPGHPGGSCWSIILVFILTASLHPYRVPQPKHLFQTVSFPLPFLAHALLHLSLRKVTS